MFFHRVLPLFLLSVQKKTEGGDVGRDKKSCVKDSNHVSGYDICEIGIPLVIEQRNEITTGTIQMLLNMRKANALFLCEDIDAVHRRALVDTELDTYRTQSDNNV